MLHAQCNVAHLDIKSPNILLTEDWRHARVADFGLGRVMDLHRSHEESHVAGTFIWAAPEQLWVGAFTLFGSSLVMAAINDNAGCEIADQIALTAF